LPDGRPWPKISIVTPSYNQGQFVEETIRSVLLQNYPNFDYIIIDGASSDRSVEIIKKYEKWLSAWVSEKDRGQSHAINKGFQKATGEILAWLNSDDTYEKNAFANIACEFANHPDADVISGQCRLWCGKPGDRMIGPSPLRTYEDFLKVGSNWMNHRLILQPEAFFRRRAYELADGVSEELHFSLDVSLWMKMARQNCCFHSFNQHLANLRIHKGQKTTDVYSAYAELCRLAWNYLQKDWDLFGKDSPLIADDIFSALEKVRTYDRTQLNVIVNSTSYRLGRSITRLRFW
jgi:glycosyltransferase involved in cell wall biosynthesis